VYRTIQRSRCHGLKARMAERAFLLEMKANGV
jgi:hypothetical protein